MTRLPPLPKEIRDAFKPDLSMGLGASGCKITPERNRSYHCIYRLSDEGILKIPPEEILYYRGHSQFEGKRSTKVYVLAVHQNQVVANVGFSVFPDFGGDKRVWNSTGEKYDHDDPVPGRKRAVAKAEHDLVTRMKKNAVERVTKAQARLDKAAHEAKASTKLAKVREHISDCEKALKELRAQEETLAREALKEAS